MRLFFAILILALTCGCLAFGSARVEREGLVASATYFRLGDQKIQDFYLDYDANGTASLGLGQQQSDATALREVLLKALGVAK